VNKTIYLFLIFIIFSSCSFNKNSKFWKSGNLEIEETKNYKEIFPNEEVLKKEFNSNLKLKIKSKNLIQTTSENYLNNYGSINFDRIPKKVSNYKFSKIKNFDQYQPEILFYKNNVIFFENKGSILKFDDKKKLLWKKNYYSKSEKKSNPILQFTNNKNHLVVADNLSKYYMLDIRSGDLIWSKKNIAPFNSQIKIYQDKFFAIDILNTLRCFSMKDGVELWNIKTENSLARSQKKNSLIIVDEIIYFVNSIGDVSAVELNSGELLWQLPTQSNLINDTSFTLQNSDIISDKNSIFFSNNKNQFFSIDIKTGSFNWENKINSNLRSTLIDKYILSISIEGFLIITEKNSGNIIRVNDIFKSFKIKKRTKIKPTGFIVGTNNIYLSTSNGRLLVIDIYSGKIITVLKIDNEKITKPFIQNNNLFLMKKNSITQLN